MGIKYESPGGAGPGAANAIAFAAGNFSATGAMTWTVDLADQVTYAFMLEGKKLTLWFRLLNTTVGGVVAGNNLLMKLPLGLLAALETVQDVSAAPGGSPSEGILALTQVGSNNVTLLRYAANWIAGANNTDVNGVVVVPVQ